jgi:adenosylcobyric acid synthase
LKLVEGVCAFAPEVAVSGYEIHMGVTYASPDTEPAFLIEHEGQVEEEGCISPDQQILGTYLHGVFDHPQACLALLEWAGCRTEHVIDLAQLREQSIDRIADACEALLHSIQAL